MTTLLEHFNEVRATLNKKPVKAGAYNQTQMRSFITKHEPVIGEFAFCPHCNAHLSNGVLAEGDEVNGEPIALTHEYECMGCGEGFGEELAIPAGETFTMADICEALGINPKVARSRYRNFDNDGVTTKYVFPRGRWDEVALIISPKR